MSERSWSFADFVDDPRVRVVAILWSVLSAVALVGFLFGVFVGGASL